MVKNNKQVEGIEQNDKESPLLLAPIKIKRSPCREMIRKSSKNQKSVLCVVRNVFEGVR